VSSVVVGAAGAGTWGQVSIGTFRWVRGTWDWAENGPVVNGAMDGDWLDTPGTSEIRRECWSRGRIVSALLVGAQGGVSSISGASESRCHHHRPALRWTQRPLPGTTPLVTRGNGSS